MTPLPAFDVDAVAFDLDGTLLDTVHDIAAAANAWLREIGERRLPKDTIRLFVGKAPAAKNTNSITLYAPIQGTGTML